MKKIMLALILLITGSSVLAQVQDKVRVMKQDRIHQEDHLRFLDGKLYRYNQGVQSQVMEQVRLANGTVVNPDGSYQLQNQERYQLNQGECMDMDGNRYRNENRFNKRRMMTEQQIEQNRTRNKQGVGQGTGNRPGNQGTGARPGNQGTGNRKGRNN